MWQHVARGWGRGASVYGIGERFRQDPPVHVQDRRLGPAAITHPSLDPLNVDGGSFSRVTLPSRDPITHLLSVLR